MFLCFGVLGQNTGNFMHGGATASLVDLVGSAAIFTVAPASGVSIEINVSYLDSAFLDVGNFSLSFFFFSFSQ